MSTPTTAPTGLRERKKARTRATIQQAALRLFHDQGYAATTVDQIVQAADVSERTFFRYFPTKADTIFYDQLEPLVAEAFVTQPAGLNAVAALRGAVKQVYSNLTPEQSELERQRQRLIAQVSGVQAVTPQKIQSVITLFTSALARRTGRAPDDAAVLAWVGAMAGVVLVTYVTWSVDPTGSRFLDRLGDALDLLEQGLPL